MKLLATITLAFSAMVSFAQNPAYDVCPIKISEAVPEATVYSQEGKTINLQEYIADKPVVVVFYRGGWCPYCMRHLSALQAAKPEMDKLGYELIAITPDNFSELEKSVENSKGFDYQLFSDKDVNAITAFGIGWTVDQAKYEKYKASYGPDLEAWSGEDHHVLPVPAVFIINQGKITYQYVNPDYSQRLSTDVLLALLR